MTAWRTSVSAFTVSASSSINFSSPNSSKIVCSDLPRSSSIAVSVSINFQPRDCVRIFPTELFPAPAIPIRVIFCFSIKFVLRGVDEIGMRWGTVMIVFINLWSHYSSGNWALLYHAFQETIVTIPFTITTLLKMKLLGWNSSLFQSFGTFKLKIVLCKLFSHFYITSCHEIGFGVARVLAHGCVIRVVYKM